jgi:hypothetical protein
MNLQGPQVAEVKNDTTALCELRMDRKEVGLVAIWIGEAIADVAGVGVAVGVGK